MKLVSRKNIILLLAALFVISGAWMAYDAFAQAQAQRRVREALNVVTLPGRIALRAADDFDARVVSAGYAMRARRAALVQPVTPAVPEPEPEPEVVIPEAVAEELGKVDLAALREVNPDVLGWIYIPDTALSYPLMQGEDNDYYLKHTWEKQRSKFGSVYMDYRNSADLSDFNTILYGHRIDAESIFASLRHYEDQSHYEAHPFVYLLTDEGIVQYDIFAAAKVDAVRGHTYRLGLRESEGQQAYINYCDRLSSLETDIVVEPGDHILTMSTCTSEGGSSDYRWVVQAVRHEAR